MKITIIGAGSVGATTAKLIADKKLCKELILIDVSSDIPRGKALDILQSCPIEYSDVKVVGTNDYNFTDNSNIIIITAGATRKPGMDRANLQDINKEIVKSCIELSVKLSPNAIIIVVTNPIDVMTYVAYKVSGFPRHKIIGMAGILDTARFKTFIARELNVSVEDVSCLVVGGHGDNMVPLPKHSAVAGIPITNLLPKSQIDQIIERTKNAGIEIINNLKTGSAYYAPASGVTQIVDAIANDRNRIIPCSVYLEDEFGLSDVCCGVPVKIGKNGVEKIIEIKFSDDEQTDFNRSVEEVKNNIAKLNI